MLTYALTYADVCLPMYAKSRELLIEVLIISAFRLMFESAKAFDLRSMLLISGGCVLPVCEMEALNRKYPSRGDLEGPSGAALKSALFSVLPLAEQRIEMWWEEVSLGKVCRCVLTYADVC